MRAAHVLTERHFLTRRLLPGGAALLLTATAVAAGLDPRGEVEDAARSALPVAVLAPEPAGVWSRTRAYTGRIEARRSSDLGFERIGRLAEVAVREGETVARGDLLARLDTRRLEARRRDTRARLAQARARLAEMRAGPRSETVAAARARVRALEEEVELLRLKRDRRERLLEGEVIAAEALDEAASSLAAREARRDAARRELDELVAGTREERVRAQEALVEQLQASLAEVRVQLEDSALHAPFAGTVAVVHADEGTVLDPGRPVVGLVEDGALEARVGVPAERAAALEPGSERRLRVAGAGAIATVRAVLPEVDRRTRTVTCVLELDGRARSTRGRARIRPGQVVRLELSERVEAPGSFWLPLAALTKGERALWSCYVVAERSGGPVVERRRVEVLSVDAERALVRGDLRGPRGARVIADGTHRVVPGQAVEPFPEGARP